MFNTILLVFTLILPDGSGHVIIKQEPTVEQCIKDGSEMQKNAQQAVEDKEISTYTGTCTPFVVDLTQGAA